jgi:hypothetical protein
MDGPFFEDPEGVPRTQSLSDERRIENVEREYTRAVEG